MSGLIVIAACLVLVDRLLFRGELLSIFIRGVREYFRPAPKKSVEEVPAKVLPPNETALLITKYYPVNGLERPGAAHKEETIESAKDPAIFAEHEQKQTAEMRHWNDPNFAVSIEDDSLYEDRDAEEEARTRLKSFLEQSTEDPEVQQVLKKYVGDSNYSEYVTDEERQEIDSFDVKAFQ